MDKDKRQIHSDTCPPDISDDDILDAMKTIPGYIDITPQDFREIYNLAYNIAVNHLAQSRKAHDVMTRDVVSVMADTSLKETAATMARHHVTGLPVLNERHDVIGVVSDKDFLFHMGGPEVRSFMEVVAQGLAGKDCLPTGLSQGKVGDIMTSPAVTITETTSVFEIARIFDDRNINRVPVCDRNGRMTGIVSRADIVRTTCMV